MLEDLWPNITEFNEVNLRIEENKRLQSAENIGEETGSVQFAKKRAEKLRQREEKERAAKEQELALQDSEALEGHEWLVE